jgi:hypothetical protein
MEMVQMINLIKIAILDKKVNLGWRLRIVSLEMVPSSGSARLSLQGIAGKTKQDTRKTRRKSVVFLSGARGLLMTAF